MARCRLCGKSGMFLKVTNNGCCTQCDAIVGNEVSQRVRVINSSLQVIDKSANSKTRLKRYDLILSNLDALKRYEAVQIPTTKPGPSVLIEEYTQARQRLKEEMDSAPRGGTKKSALEEASALSPDDPVVSMTVTSVMDDETCPLCKFLDGKTLAIDHPDIKAMTPPLHDGCHCMAMYNQRSMRPAFREENYDRPPADLIKRYMSSNHRALLKEKD